MGRSIIQGKFPLCPRMWNTAGPTAVYFGDNEPANEDKNMTILNKIVETKKQNAEKHSKYQVMYNVPFVSLTFEFYFKISI